MSPHDIPQFFGQLAVILAMSMVLGRLARVFGQPSVLGELFAGLLVGKSVLGLIEPSSEVFPLLGELGVVLLLFSIGLETDLSALLHAGAAATTVAVAGVILPFGMGYGLSLWFGLPSLAALVIGAALTATSVGITARVLSDLGQLQSPEGRVILGAAILDDVIGLVILTIVSTLTEGQAVSAFGIARTTIVAFGFLIAAVALGRLLVPRLGHLLAATSSPSPGAPAVLALVLALGLGWLADRVGSAAILGAFAAGLVLAGSRQLHEIEVGITRLGHVFVPLFFVTVGAAVDLSVLNPLNPANHRTLLISVVLTAAAIAGKFAAGYAPLWFKGKRSLIGAGMIPRGEVGLIFAQMGHSGGVLDRSLFAALTVVVLTTTFLAPPLLKFLAPPALADPDLDEFEAIERLANDP